MVSEAGINTLKRCPSCLDEIRQRSFLERLVGDFLSFRFMNFSSQPWLFEVNDETWQEKIYGPDPRDAFFLHENMNSELLGELRSDWSKDSGAPYLYCRFCGNKYRDNDGNLKLIGRVTPIYKKWWV